MRRFFVSACVLVSVFISAHLMGERLDLEINFKKCPEIVTTFEGVDENEYGIPLVFLSDGSQWIVGEWAADEIDDEWCFGDDIRIAPREPGSISGRFLLKNVQNGDVCFADLDPDCIDPWLAFYIEDIDRNGYAILTDGDLQFSIGFWGSMTTSKWRIGDRIIINKSDYASSEDYLIINADCGTSVWASLIEWR